MDKKMICKFESSNLLFARKDDLTEVQKEIIIDYVESHMLGVKVADTKETLMEHFREDRGWSNEDFNKTETYGYKQYKETLQRIENGFSIYAFYISKKDDTGITQLTEGLWCKLEESSPGDFIRIPI